MHNQFKACLFPWLKIQINYIVFLKKTLANVQYFGIFFTFLTILFRVLLYLPMVGVGYIYFFLGRKV